MPSLIPKLFSPKGIKEADKLRRQDSRDDIRQCFKSKGSEGKLKLSRRDSNPEEQVVKLKQEDFEDLGRTDGENVDLATNDERNCREDVNEDSSAVNNNMESECADLLDNCRYYDNDKSNSDATESEETKLSCEKTKKDQSDSIYGSMSDIDSENANSADRKFGGKSSGAKKDEFQVVRRVSLLYNNIIMIEFYIYYNVLFIFRRFEGKFPLKSHSALTMSMRLSTNDARVICRQRQVP